MKGKRMNKTLINILAWFVPKIQRRQFRAFLTNGATTDISVSEWLHANIVNPVHFDDVQEAYTFFKEQEQIAFLPIHKQRLRKVSFQVLVPWVQKRTDKPLAFLTDSDFLPADMKRVQLQDIADMPDRDMYTYVLAYDKDFLARQSVAELRRHGLTYFSLEHIFPTTRYFQTDPDALAVLEDVAAATTYLNVPDYENIMQAIRNARKLDGDYVEIGVYTGKSAYVALDYMKRAGAVRHSWFLDTFEGFNYAAAKLSEDKAWNKDGDALFSDTSLEGVRKFLMPVMNPQATLLKSNIIEDGLPSEIKKIAVANIDVDMYEAVAAALAKIQHCVVPGGILLVEDYGHTPNLVGAQMAVHEFLERHGENFMSVYMESGQMMLVRR
jgi:hypothetical protein